MDADRDGLRTRIQSLVSTGALPCEDCVVTWYGQGRARDCAACEQRILGTETEIECDVPGGGSVHFHLWCYDAWQSVLAVKS